MWYWLKYFKGVSNNSCCPFRYKSHHYILNIWWLGIIEHVVSYKWRLFRAQQGENCGQYSGEHASKIAPQPHLYQLHPRILNTEKWPVSVWTKFYSGVQIIVGSRIGTDSQTKAFNMSVIYGTREVSYFIQTVIAIFQWTWCAAFVKRARKYFNRILAYTCCRNTESV